MLDSKCRFFCCSSQVHRIFTHTPGQKEIKENRWLIQTKCWKTEKNPYVANRLYNNRIWMCTCMYGVCVACNGGICFQNTESTEKTFRKTRWHWIIYHWLLLGFLNEFLFHLSCLVFFRFFFQLVSQFLFLFSRCSRCIKWVHISPLVPWHHTMLSYNLSARLLWFSFTSVAKSLISSSSKFFPTFLP